MPKHKRPRLSEREKNYLLMVGSHGTDGAHTEFVPNDIRKLARRLRDKALLQWDWRDKKWLLTPRDGFAEYQRLFLDSSR